MTERMMAYHICKVYARDIVDECGGHTMSGVELSEKYTERLYKAGGYNPMEIFDYSQALRHWVDAVGYNKSGNFEICISDSIKV